jgi:hypothetical protein
MDIIQTSSILFTIIASAYYIHRDLIIETRAQSARTDKLYEMFIDLLKEGGK